MRFEFTFYSSLLLIFFVHMLVYCVLFIIKYKQKAQQSALWAGLFLLVAALYIAPWMLGFAGWYDHQPYRDILFYTPFQQLYLIGPFVFFYVSSLFNPAFKLKGKLWLHLLPAALYLLYSLTVVVYDKLVRHDYVFLKNGEDPDFDDWYQITGFISMITYFFAVIRYYNAYKLAVEAVISNAALFLFKWVRNFLVAFLIILVARLIMAILGLFYTINFDATWWYFLSFAICSYYIAVAGYSNAVETRLFFKTAFFTPGQDRYFLRPYNPALLPVPGAFEEVYLENDVTDTGSGEDFTVWKERVEVLMRDEKLYENPELNLFEIAGRLNTNISFLSKVINRSFNANFNDLVNSYRVSSFIALLKQEEHKKQTLLSLAFECGFNSKTTFNRAFRKINNCSPQQYIKDNQL